MRSHRLTPPPPCMPPAKLIDDAIAEILLRLPPDDPACLVRVSLVCKLWHRILSEPTFPNRYREFHQTPPLLGFLRGHYYTCSYDEPATAPRFVPVVAPTHIPFRLPTFGCRPLDCRHGRVLLDMVDGNQIRQESLAVWDPVTGDHRVLRDNPDPASGPFGHSGAVLCAAAGCNHHGCHGGPFKVVFVSTSYNNNAARAWVYSSETATWSAPASVQILYDDGHASVERKRAAIVGEQIYFLLGAGAGILKYDLGKGCLTVIGSPSPCTYMYTRMLMNREDGSLGFAGVKDDFTTLDLWATKVNPNGSMGWVQDRVILLNNLPVSVIGTADTYDKVIDVVGFAEGVDILLLAVEDGTGFMFELKSGQFRKLSKPEYYYYDDFVPYLSFYIPDFAKQK